MIIRNHKPKPLELTKDQIASIRKKQQSPLESSDKQVSIQKQDEPKPIGLGDRVERIAQPIARVIDKVAGTNIQGCGSCQRRKEWLNNMTLKNKLDD